MIRALITTLSCGIFIAICWWLTFHFAEQGPGYFYILLSLPIILVIFSLSFEWQDTDKKIEYYFREMKRLEVEIELNKELWWWLPSETRMK